MRIYPANLNPNLKMLFMLADCVKIAKRMFEICEANLSSQNFSKIPFVSAQKIFREFLLFPLINFFKYILMYKKIFIYPDSL